MKEREKYSMQRRALNIKLKDISKYVGCSSSLISQYENGHCDLSDEKLIKYKRFIREKIKENEMLKNYLYL